MLSASFACALAHLFAVAGFYTVNCIRRMWTNWWLLPTNSLVTTSMLTVNPNNLWNNITSFSAATMSTAKDEVCQFLPEFQNISCATAPSKLCIRVRILTHSNLVDKNDGDQILPGWSCCCCCCCCCKLYWWWSCWRKVFALIVQRLVRARVPTEAAAIPPALARSALSTGELLKCCAAYTHDGSSETSSSSKLW